MKQKFEILDHTADLRIKVFAETLPELFENSAYAMFHIIGGDSFISPKITEEISIKGDNLEDILIEWLNELLYMFNVKKILFVDFEVKLINNIEIKVLAKGVEFNLKNINTEIKAVTYHNVRIKKNEKYTVEIIFDV